jgi:hypothetical protein
MMKKLIPVTAMVAMVLLAAFLALAAKPAPKNKQLGIAAYSVNGLVYRNRRIHDH